MSLQVAQMNMKRKISQITPRDHIRDADNRKRTQTKDASQAAQGNKWRWTGHVVRLDYSRWAHAVIIWDQGSELRPATRWTDDKENKRETVELIQIRLLNKENTVRVKNKSRSTSAKKKVRPTIAQNKFKTLNN